MRLTEPTEKQNIRNSEASRIGFLPYASAKGPQKRLPKNAPNMHTASNTPSFPNVILPGRTSLCTTIGSSVKCL